MTIGHLPLSGTPQDVLAEIEYRDPNGETQTASTRVPLWPAAHVVGVRAGDWAAARGSLRADVAVVDVRGKPVAGAPVEVEVFHRDFYSYRKRLVGGFYAYEHVEEVRRAGPLCRGVTDGSGRFECEGKPPASGRLVLQASMVDPAGRRSTANQEVWAAGDDEWWFEARESDRIDLVPEQRCYEPGDTARLQVRLPFREATALVTVDRQGVLDARVITLGGNAPVIEVPIASAWAPNVFISTLVVRGRVGGVQPTALVDLGRPAFKLGIAEIKVGWRAYDPNVTVTTDRAVYRTRERAHVRITARTATGAPPPGGEVAVAAVDEGLLELAANPTWNLLDAMMRRRSDAVSMATAQMHVVGRRHFGWKALPQGGAGGRQPTRELFDTLLFWRARVPLDGDGRATVEVPLNDAITGFRIGAVASAGEALFGTGATSIRTTQDLMVLPGIAPIAREGDRVRPEVTLRNATDRPMEVAVAGKVTGFADALAPREVTLEPGQAQAVGWDVTIPVGVTTLRWEIEAAARDGAASDRVAVTQTVVPAVPVRVYQATLTRVDGPLRVPVERPADAQAGRGGLTVTLRPTLVDGLVGVRDWMSRYPYTCLEQQVSRAVALGDERWREIADALPGSQDKDGLLKFFPTLELGSEMLTAYVLAIAQEAGWRLPHEAESRATAGLRKFVTGAIARRGELPTADLSICKLAAVEALARYGLAEPALVDSIAIEPNLWPTSAVLDWWSILRRVPAMPQREPRLREAEQILRARLTVQGTTIGFSTERADSLWWLMVTPDVNALRLVLALVDAGAWKDEVPRLMRGALGRQRRGAWDTTTANAWGALAVAKFSRAYESTPVTGVTTAALAGASRRVDWTEARSGGALAFPWPPRREDVVVEQVGTGHPWVTIEARAAIPLAAPIASGYRIAKSFAPVEKRDGGPAWHRGDLVRVRLEIEAQSDMTWVVVDDPIPAGASHLGSGLGGQSRIATQGEQGTRLLAPAFVERGFEGFRAYYPFVPKGSFVVEYTIRLNQSGRFELPPTRVEALYAPESFGELPNRPFTVAP